MKLANQVNHAPCDHTATFDSPSSYQHNEPTSESAARANRAFSCKVYSQTDIDPVVPRKLALIDRSRVGLDRRKLGLNCFLRNDDIKFSFFKCFL